MPLCSTVMVKKWSHIFTILLFGFFLHGRCSWNIQLFLVIVRDSLLARISPAAHLHHSHTTDTASLVPSGWKCGFFLSYSVLILQSDVQGCSLWGAPHFHGSVSPGGIQQLPGAAVSLWVCPQPSRFSLARKNCLGSVQLKGFPCTLLHSSSISAVIYAVASSLVYLRLLARRSIT